jgi:hypothetical protein
MGRLYRVTVTPSYRWSEVQVAGQPFSKHSVTELNEDAINDEILNSPLLEVEVVEPEPELKPERPKRKRRKSEVNDVSKNG